MSAVKAVNSVINPILAEKKKKTLSGTEPESTIKGIAENHLSAFMTIQRDLFSALLSETIKTICYYKELVSVYCFMATPDCLGGSWFYYIQSKKTEFLSGVCVELKSPEASQSQREKRHAKKTEGNNISHIQCSNAV